MHRSGLLLVALLLSACAARPAAPPQPAGTPPALAAIIDSITNRPPLHRTSWGILIVDGASGQTIYERNADRLFIPASNTKLVVASTSLGRFGPDYRYRTPVRVRARGGDTAAALILAGRGDPTWSTRFHVSATTPIDSMAALVALSGLRRISVLVIDASRFTDDLVNPTWEVGDLPWQYAPPIDAVALAEGVFRVVVEGGATAGADARVSVLGPLSVPIAARVRTDTAGAPARLSVDYRARRDTVFVSGSVGAAAADTSTLAQTDPAGAVADAFASSLRQRGVTVGGVEVVRERGAGAELEAGAELLTEWVSAPMQEIVRVIMRPSQNWVAEQVVKTLGAELGGEGSWREGIAVERAWLHEVVGIDSGAVNLRDASGMSAQNLLTPRSTVSLLRHAQAQTWGGAFRSTLAGPGIAGSTLNNRLRQLEGRLAGKTGTISNVNSLSGYLTTDTGRDIVFAIMTNGSGQPSSTVRSAIDDIVITVATYKAAN